MESKQEARRYRIVQFGKYCIRGLKDTWSYGVIPGMAHIEMWFFSVREKSRAKRNEYREDGERLDREYKAFRGNNLEIEKGVKEFMRGSGLGELEKLIKIKGNQSTDWALAKQQIEELGKNSGK